LVLGLFHYAFAFLNAWGCGKKITIRHGDGFCHADIFEMFPSPHRQHSHKRRLDHRASARPVGKAANTDSLFPMHLKDYQKPAASTMKYRLNFIQM
jgi:hypothetical protein